MNTEILKAIENLLDEKLKPIKDDINNLVLEINNINNGINGLSKPKSKGTLSPNDDYGFMDTLNFNNDNKPQKTDVETIWAKAKQMIKSELTEISYNTWINPIIPVKLEQGVIFLETNSTFSKDIISSRYLDLIKTAIFNVTSRNYDIKIKINDLIMNEDKNISEKLKGDKFKSIFDEKCTFDSFVVGKFNHSAYKSVKYMAEDINKNIRLLYIYGKKGMGKSHLLNAVGYYIYIHNPGKRVIYLTIEDFTNQMIESIRTDKREEFLNNFKGADFIMIDDLQYILGKERTQEEFYRVVSELLNMDKQIIIASIDPPEQINIQNDCFSKTFEINGVFEIGELDFDDRLLVLKERACIKNININDEILELIAENEDYSIRELINILNRLEAYADIMGESITKELVENIINEGVFREN